MLQLEQELKNNAYPGRGVVIGRSDDGRKAAIAYFIMGRSVNSRNRIFVTEGEGIRTRPLTRPSSQTPAWSSTRLCVCSPPDRELTLSSQTGTRRTRSTRASLEG